MNAMKQLLLILLCVFYSISCLCQVKVTMEKQGNVYYVPGKVNGLSMKFIFDTGASNVCLSLTEALFMLKNGYIKESDIGEKGYAQIANGNIVENTKVVLRNIEIGGVTIKDVAAVVSNSLDAPLLLGQSAIQKLGPIQLDGNTLIIANGKNIPSEEIARKLYTKAYQQVEAEEYDKAIESSLEAISYTNDKKLRAALYDNLGCAYYCNGNKEKAIESQNHALEEDMNFIQARYNLGVYSYEMGLYEQASRAFQLVISNPNSNNTDCLPAAYAYLGEIQRMQGCYKEGEESFLKSIQLHPSSMAYLGLADLYAAKNNFVKAAEYYKKGIEYEPNRPSNIKRYHQLGMCLFFADRTSEAHDAFCKCIETASLYHDVMDEFIKKNDSEIILLASLSLDAELWLARTAPGAYEIIEGYKRIINQNREQELVREDYIKWSTAYASCNEIEKAIDVLNKGLEKYNDNPDLLFAKSQINPQWQEKIDILRKILNNEYKYEPRYFDYGTVYNNIAWEYCLQKKYNEGLPYSLKAIQRNPEHGYSWETLGEIYFNLGKYQECIDAMTKCIGCNDASQYKSAYRFRGLSYIKMGKEKEGKKDINQAKDM